MTSPGEVALKSQTDASQPERLNPARAMTGAADPVGNERQFSDDQRFAVLTLHE